MIAKHAYKLFFEFVCSLHAVQKFFFLIVSVGLVINPAAALLQLAQKNQGLLFVSCSDEAKTQNDSTPYKTVPLKKNKRKQKCSL